MKNIALYHCTSIFTMAFQFFVYCEWFSIIPPKDFAREQLLLTTVPVSLKTPVAANPI